MAYVYARDIEESKRTDAFFGEGFEKALNKSKENGNDLIVGEFFKDWKEDI